VALLTEISFGSCRWFHQLEIRKNRSLQKPIKKQDGIANFLLIIGLYQLYYTRIPAHAAIFETVEAADGLGIAHLKGLINAVLRNAQRQVTEMLPADSALSTDDAETWSHPKWMLAKIRANWPLHYREILDANNQRAPLVLRVNQLKSSRADYMQQLAAAGLEATPTPYSAWGVVLQTATDVKTLPGFDEGLFSVQDEAAQLCSTLLQVAPGHLVLDACAAPGGKTTAIFEASEGKAIITALDSDAERLQRVHENLLRLEQTAKVICADASTDTSWWDGQYFDRILVDVPCSATGVIRRHPDIKLLRRENDIVALAQTQLAILQTLWPTLKPGGRLVYATCSIFPQENNRIIERFLKYEIGASAIFIDAEWGLCCEYGRQLLPQNNGHDGFFYACLEKR
jgi:16S rRNA (cytosine967-C5)-methyltransferase